MIILIERPVHFMRKKHKRRLRKKDIIKHRIILTTSFLSLTFILATGYSAFSTNLTLNTKGNIKELTAAQFLKAGVITTGDGLYKDTTEEGRYIYKGKSPNNYIKFNNELWHIVSIETDSTLKIIRKNSIGMLPFDEPNNRNNENNTYCNHTSYNDADGSQSYNGCGIWGKINGTYNNSVYSGTITENSTLNNYLNTTYLDSLKDRNHITSHTFYTGTTRSDASVEELTKTEKTETWYGTVGLINTSDFIKSSTNSECKTKNNSRTSSNPCSYENGNYLSESKVEMWVLDHTNGVDAEKYGTGYSITQHNTADQNGLGWLSGYYSNWTYDVKPTLFLKSTIKIKGNGTTNEPYQIIN